MAGVTAPPVQLPWPRIDRDALVIGVDIVGGYKTGQEREVPWPWDPSIRYRRPLHPCYDPPTKLNPGPQWGPRATTVYREGLYIGCFRGFAVVLYDPEGPFCIPPDRLVWTRALASPISVLEFQSGYVEGWEKGWEKESIGKRSMRNIPSDYGRGFAWGHKDGFRSANCRAQFEPYNENVRQLQTDLPAEWGCVPDPEPYPFEIIGFGDPDQPGPVMHLEPGEIPLVRLKATSGPFFEALDVPGISGEGKPVKWAAKYDKCQNPECKTPQAKHKGYGLCRNCLARHRHQTDPLFHAKALDTKKQSYRKRAAKKPKIEQPKRWARKCDHCQNPSCTTPGARHCAKGLCYTCYARSQESMRERKR